MSDLDVTAGQVMNGSAALLNDTQKQMYGFTEQLPYLQIALKELRETFELNNVPCTKKTSAAITLVAGVTELSFLTTPAIPDDFITFEQLWERNTGIDPYIPMTQVEFLPHYMEGTESPSFIWFTWDGDKFTFLPSTADNDIKMDYIQNLFTTVVDENSALNVIGSSTFLTYRTAGLCAEFIGENPTRAQSLNQDAILALDRTLGINTKDRQSISTRRRPFRAAYRTRGIW